MPEVVAAGDAAVRWAGMQRRADGLSQTLYALRETAPDASLGRAAALADIGRRGAIQRRRATVSIFG